MKWIPIIALVLLLTGCGPEKAEPVEWKESPTFDSAGQIMRGNEGHLAILDTPFIAGEHRDYVWHFWGSTPELAGKLTLTAVHQDSGTRATLVEREFMVPVKPLNGADNHAVTLLSLPSKGLWRLTAYINGQFFGSIVVQAQ